MADSFQAYINMVTGVTKSSQEKAAATARALLKQAGLEDVATETSERVTKLTEEILHASRTNRELWQHFVMAEVDKVAARLGLARADEVQALRDEVAGLRAQLNAATARTAKFASAKATTKKASTRKAAATMTPSNKATKRAPGAKPPDTAAANAESSPQPGEE
ncbi:MAG TPA: hypothetical protein VFP01_08545 [Propionibacteriaceae bacterium]|nr:hypothetical protein [Propionibacteriaceae bacterium]